MEQDPIFHKVVLSEREKLTVTGVKEVIHFEDTGVLMDTSQGNLQIHGRELRLKNLNPQGGKLELTGVIEALVYEENRAKGGFLSRIFG